MQHKLQLITTSVACERVLSEPPRTGRQVLMDSDAMAVCVEDVKMAQEGIAADSMVPSPAAEALRRADAVHARFPSSSSSSSGSPADVVGAKLLEAASAAAGAAAPLANNVTLLSSNVVSRIVDCLVPTSGFLFFSPGVVGGWTGGGGWCSTWVGTSRS